VLIGCPKFGFLIKIIEKCVDRLIKKEKDYFVEFVKIDKEKDIFYNVISKTAKKIFI
jgi:hypothetical protein